MTLAHRSQSALEYMMTYGWAILVIVIVAAVLYSLGIFSPASSISSTVTGFSNLGSVTAECFNGGGLVLSLGDSTGNPIEITKINTTSQTGTPLSANFSTVISPSGSVDFVVAGACSNTSGVRYSNHVIVTYTEPGQVFPGPYNSEGTVTGQAITQSAVASFGPALSYINTSVFPEWTSLNTLTFEFWFKSSQTWSSTYWPGSGVIISKWTPNGCSSDWGALGGSQSSGTNDGQVVIGFGASACTSSGIGVRLYSQTGLNNGVWYQVVATRTPDGVDYLYIDGVEVSSESDPGGTITNNRNIQIGNDVFAPNGDYPNGAAQFIGEVADVQIYNYTLSPQQVASLYKEGLGGSPISNYGLVNWWPLDGNANDYSGNNNNGVAINVNWVSP